MKKSISLLILIIFSNLTIVSAQNFTLSSPDSNIDVNILSNETLALNVSKNGESLFSVKNISIESDKGLIPATLKAKLKNKRSVSNIIIPQIKEKFDKINEKYNEIEIEFKDKTRLLVRAYNEGVAYRLYSDKGDELTIMSEKGDFIFNENDNIIYQQDRNRSSSSEEPYVETTISELKDNAMGNLPLLVQKKSGKCIIMMESDVTDFPSLWVEKGDPHLKSFHWQYPTETLGGKSYYNSKNVVKHEDFIAKTDGTRWYPWRVFGIADKEIDLIKNQLVYLLAPECKIEDPSWIKPGWVAFDWWARTEIHGVDFVSGINNETAKYMIDFAKNYNIKYFLFDDGWTANNDLTQYIDAVDIPAIAEYGKQNGVDVMLWVSYAHLDSQMEQAIKKFSEWGIKGIKLDFINRNDQQAVNFYRRTAEVCAKYGLVIDFHGCFVPNGLRREYPNILTREGLIEFEYNCINGADTPRHHCLLPFIRNVVGPMDYIPATMNNASKSQFRVIGHQPMGQGTRSHAMALSIMAESPMQMLPGGPSDYYKEDECTRFITQTPVEWDETTPLDGKVGEYLTLARRKGSNWYIASYTNENKRVTKIDFSFLPEDREYTIEIFRDGPNAHNRGTDYIREIKKITPNDVWDIQLAPAGGFAARIF